MQGTAYRLQQDDIVAPIEPTELSNPRACRTCVYLGIWGTEAGCKPWDQCEYCLQLGHTVFHCPNFRFPAYQTTLPAYLYAALIHYARYPACDSCYYPMPFTLPLNIMMTVDEEVTVGEQVNTNFDGPTDDNDGGDWIGSNADVAGNDWNPTGNGDAGSSWGANGAEEVGEANLGAMDSEQMASGEQGACHHCGDIGHQARECPSRPPMVCFNCNEEGHGKGECTKERVVRPYLGTCLFCKTKGHHVDNCPTKPDDYVPPPKQCFVCMQEGHSARECPEKPPVVCFNCKQEGHTAAECSDNRIFDDVPDMEPAQAWAKIIEADTSHDPRAFREAIRMYAKAVPEMTWVKLEEALRDPKDPYTFSMHIIATAKELPVTRTYINLQGEQDKKYQINFCLSDKPKRARQNEGWPESADENMERLKDAGMPMDRGVVQCRRCEELGHTVKDCPQEKVEDTEPKFLPCVNCDEEGHRLRDCPKPRKVRGGGACRNCNEEGHKASECPNPRDMTNVECRKCGETGHMSKECPNEKCKNCLEPGHIAKDCEQPRNPASVVCRNCEETGHFAKDCPKPKDWSKVICSNCKQPGHTVKRCKEALIDDSTGEEAGTNDALAPTSGEGWGAAGTAAEDTPLISTEANWGASSATPAADEWNASAGISKNGW